MRVAVREQGEIAIVEPAGSIAGRSAIEFEREIVTLLDKGTRFFAINFSGTDLITSAGIRVIMLLAQRTRGDHGGAVLYALSSHVKSVFEIAGLLGQFQVTADEPTALATLGTLGAGASTRSVSKLTRLARRLIGPTEAISDPGGDRDTSALTRAVAAVYSAPAGPNRDAAS